MRDDRYPYWVVCDVEGCEAETCNGGWCWRETGYWGVCAEHARQWREGLPMPDMKPDAVARETTRHPGTGILPNEVSK